MDPTPLFAILGFYNEARDLIRQLHALAQRHNIDRLQVLYIADQLQCISDEVEHLCRQNSISIKCN